jgi:hypothetical protein
MAFNPIIESVQIDQDLSPQSYDASVKAILFCIEDPPTDALFCKVCIWVFVGHVFDTAHTLGLVGHLLSPWTLGFPPL